MPFSVTRVGGSFAAEVSDIDLSRELDDAEWQALHAAYLEHQVLFFHEQELTAKQFHRFGACFSPVEPHSVRTFRHPEAPGITLLSNRTELGRPKGIRDAGSHWHSDYSYKKVTANATLLYALEIPDQGGDTLFADMAAAYAALPDTTKRRLDGLKARHQYRWTRDPDHPEGRMKLMTEQERQELPEIVHPVVRTHPETGRRGIYVFPGITSGVKTIVGMDEAESDALLAELYAHCTQERFQYRFEWRVGDLVLWDNRTTMHAATTAELPPDRFRTLYRINTTGSIPV